MIIRNKDKIVLLILLVNLLTLLGSIYISGLEGGRFSIEKFEEKSVILLSDTIRNLNIFKFVVENKAFPDIGDIEPNTPAHPPLYYFLLAPVVSFSQANGINIMLSLEIFSVFIMFLVSIIFWRCLERIGKHIENKNFVIYGVAFFCFLPSTLATSRMITPDVLFFLFFSLALYFLIRVIEDKSGKDAFLLGITLMLSLWTWLSTIPLLIAIFIFIGFLHHSDKLKERNLLFLAFLIGVIGGSFSLIRNLLVYGGDLVGNAAYSSTAMHQGTNIILVITRIFGGYWGGVYGGISDFRILIGLSIVLFLIMFIYGVNKYVKIENNGVKAFLNFTIIFFIIFVLFGIHHNCDIFKFLSTGGCYGWGTQGRYLIPLNPFIGIFASIGLISLEKINKKFKWLNYLFVFLISVLFAIDFLVAFR